MELPPVTTQLVRRFEDAMHSLHLAAKRELERLPGNPFGFEIRQWGAVDAHVAHHATGPSWWNRAYGLDDAGEDVLDEVVAFYRASGKPWFTDTVPGTMDETLGRRLVSRGLSPTGFDTVLYGLAQEPRKVAAPGVEIRQVGPEEAGLVAGLWAAGFEVPLDAEGQMMRDIRRGWFTVPDNRCYVAYVQGQPAAMAALYVHDHIGFLNVGATQPAYRRLGCHAALVVRRIADAAEAGCDLVIGHTGFGRQSQANEQRLGLQVAYTPMGWRHE